MGRPLIDIDPIMVEKMASLGCKTVEIADYFGCTKDTITNRFSSELDKGRSSLKMSLRQLQIKSAQNGNVAMLIWLGKQYLDQQDKTQLILEKVTDEMLVAEAQRRLTDGTKS
jgi:hypothetical protein